MTAGNGGGDDELRSLVERVRSGQTSALEQLSRHVRGMVRTWAAKLTKDADAADDVAQDVLIDLERRVQQFRGESRFSTWLFTVTRHVALSRNVRERRRATLLARHHADPQTNVAPEIRDIDARALGALVLRYVNDLPRRQRQIFELADIQGWTPAEIARELRMEQSTVRVHLFKARHAIRTRLLERHRTLLEEYRS